MTRFLQTFAFWAAALLVALATPPAHAQPEVAGWGELRGLRVDGELVPLRTGVGVGTPDNATYAAAGHWRTREQHFGRDGDTLTSRGRVEQPAGPPIDFTQTVTPAGPNALTLELTATVGPMPEPPADETPDADADNTNANAASDAADAPPDKVVWFNVRVPRDFFGPGRSQLLDPATPLTPDHGDSANADTNAPDPHAHAGPASFGDARTHAHDVYLRGDAAGVRLAPSPRTVEVRFDRSRPLAVEDSRIAWEGWVSVSAPLLRSPLTPGDSATVRCTVTVTGEPDRTPAVVHIDADRAGPAWEGVGGNFCWGTDTPAVAYYMDRLDLAWGRVNIPLNDWHPDEDADPAAVPLDELPEMVHESLAMGRALHARGVPIMGATWNAPAWALASGDPAADAWSRRSRLDPEKVHQLAASLAAYLLMFRDEVGTEPVLFSFNEPNLGINVRQTPAEHRDHNKIIGQALAGAGLKTKMILGDTNEPGATDYVLPTLEDPEAMQYVGALAYHSWNGGSDEELVAWRRHAERAELPLYVTEAGTDPDAFRYRPILGEPWYAVEEARTYLRTINLSHAGSILHWQLTSDYGFVRPSRDEPGGLAPTQRWWQYRQLAELTPRRGAILHARADKPALTAAAVADADGSVGVVHLVNAAAARPVTITGLRDAGSLRVVVTDADRGMAELAPVPVTQGRARLAVPAQSFVTLTPTR